MISEEDLSTLEITQPRAKSRNIGNKDKTVLSKEKKCKEKDKKKVLQNIHTVYKKVIF